MEHPEVFWEERLVRPVDIYPQFQSEGPTFLPRSGPSAYKVKSIFVRIDTDDGTTGTGGPITEEQAFIIKRTMAPLLVGAGPTGHGKVVGHPLPLLRARPQGRRDDGHQRAGLCPLGPEGPAFRGAGLRVARRANTDVGARLCIGPGLFLGAGCRAARAVDLVAQGFRATKWFPRHGPADGVAG